MTRTTASSIAAMALLSSASFAQVSASKQVPAGPGGQIDFLDTKAGENFTRNIVLTGYWPPTNNQVRRFSPKPSSNPDGWIGQDWEGRGWNIISFFPEFPGQTGPSWGQGSGDFEVDYQDTSADWELEGGNRMYSPSQWTSDYAGERKPGADLPIMQALSPGTELFSSLPIDDIMAGVDRDVPELNTFSPTIDNGRFLSNYIGLHGNWYHSMNNAPDAEYRNFAAGHIHVGYGMSDTQAELATLSTLRTLTDTLNGVIPAPGTAAVLSLGLLAGARRRR